MKNFAILVNSCDAYFELWQYFFRLLKLNWPDVDKYKIYLNTESISEFRCELSIAVINTPPKKKDIWGKRLLHCLNSIKEDYVVVLMDDFFLKEKVSTDAINKCILSLKNNPNIAVCYLANTYNRDFLDSDIEGFTEIPKFTNYRLNSLPAIWKRKKLIAYTEESDSPWAWEYFGTCRTNYTNDVFLCASMKKPIYEYCHAIYRGKWLEKEIKPLISKYELNIDMTNRGAIKEEETLPKRSKLWKIRFVLTGIRMAGLDALKEIYRNKRYTK